MPLNRGAVRGFWHGLERDSLHCLLLIVNGRASLLCQLEPKWSLTALSGSLSGSVAGQESGWFSSFHLQIAGVRSWNLRGNLKKKKKWKKVEKQREKENPSIVCGWQAISFSKTLVNIQQRSKDWENWQTKVWKSWMQNKHVRRC